MELLKKLFVHLHFNHASRVAWRAKLRSDWRADNNHVYIIKNGKRHECKGVIPGLAIRIDGKNNCVEIDETCHTSDTEIWISGNHNHIRVEENTRLTRLYAIIADNNRLFAWGAGSRCEQARVLVQDRDLIIGKECMLSDQIEIMASDAHTICDKNTGEMINRLTGQMIIGDHVWIGRRVFLTKRTNIPSGCVVGASSVVTKPFTEENCVIAGFPAKVIKKGIEWHEISTSGYMQTYQKTK